MIVASAKWAVVQSAKPLACGPEATCDQCTISESESIWEFHQVLLFCHHVVRHTTITLPAIKSSVVIRSARDLETTATISAHSTTAHEIDDHAIAFSKPTHPRSASNHLPTRLMASRHIAVALDASVWLLVVDESNVTAANRGRLDSQQDLTVARFGHWHIPQFQRGRGAVNRQKQCLHCGHRLPNALCTSQTRILGTLLPFHVL